MIQFLLCLVKTENDMDSLRIETNSSTQFKKMVYNTIVGHTFKHQNVFLLCILTSGLTCYVCMSLQLYSHARTDIT